MRGRVRARFARVLAREFCSPWLVAKLARTSVMYEFKWLLKEGSPTVGKCPHEFVGGRSRCLYCGRELGEIV